MSTTTNLETLKINYLTSAQYQTALNNGQINENEIYLTPSSGSGGGGGNTNSEELTQAEYDALTTDEKNNGTIYFVPEGDFEQAVVFDLVPIGSIQAYGGSTPPSGWLICDGTAVSRATYDELFSVIGTTYGSGDGNTTFNLPDLRGRTIIGEGTGTATDATAHALGNTGGEETHTLTTNEMPNHNHNSSKDSYGLGMIVGTAGQIYGVWSGTTGYKTGSTGGGQAHNNMQPYVVTNYIIKATDTTTFDVAHPIGSYFETSDSGFNPNNEWGGTWVSETRTDDYIVDEGTSGIWIYRKWNSGIAECWGTQSATASVSTAWGNTYYGSVNMPNFPSIFITTPNRQATLSTPGGMAWLVPNSTNLTSTSPGGMFIFSGANVGNVGCTICVYAVGKWKNDTASTVYKWHRTA